MNGHRMDPIRGAQPGAMSWQDMTEHHAVNDFLNDGVAVERLASSLGHRATAMYHAKTVRSLARLMDDYPKWPTANFRACCRWMANYMSYSGGSREEAVDALIHTLIPCYPDDDSLKADLAWMLAPSGKSRRGWQVCLCYCDEFKHSKVYLDIKECIYRHDLLWDMTRDGLIQSVRDVVGLTIVADRTGLTRDEIVEACQSRGFTFLDPRRPEPWHPNPLEWEGMLLDQAVQLEGGAS